MIVADASLLANFLNPVAGTNAAEAVFKKDSDWHAPPLWRYEMHNTLLKYLRAGALTLAQSEGIMEQAATLLGDSGSQASTAQVLQAATTHKVSAYDAEYIALAKVLRVPLITFDQKLVRAAPRIALPPADFLR